MEDQQNKEKFGLPMEANLGNQIFEALQGPMIEKILKLAKVPFSSSYHRSILEGHSFKVEESTLARLHRLFNEIKERLNFTEPVDFYITGDASVNAFAIASQEENEPHIINVNSSLIQLMTDDELRFVVGHEMGHLINQNARLMRLITFIFPEETQPPITLQYKIRLWQQLSELVADRFGFLAMPNLNVCISAFFKMASGLDFDKMDMKVEAFLEENNKRLDYFRNDKGLNFASHPINPIRVQALNLFSKSEFFIKGGTKSDELQKQMDDLTNILLKIRNGELDFYMGQFIATAGLVMTSSDEDFDQLEIDTILNELSNYQIFPKSYLEEIAKQDVWKLFIESVRKIFETNPDAREPMLRYMIGIVMADKFIKEKEINVLFDIAQNTFGYSPIEIAQIFAQMIQTNFIPNLSSLC